MKIICIGRNYAEHAAELKNEVPDEPVVFLKPETSLLRNGETFYYPDFSNDIHFECELVFRIGKNGKHISKEFAHRYVDGMTLGIDFTARDLQKKCKEKGLPWERAKAFDGSAAVGEFTSLPEGGWENISFSLLKNGTQVQEGKGNQMIFSLDFLIESVSSFITLKKGDLIFTGTPAGVGPVSKGDQLKGLFGEQQLLELQIR